MIIFLVVLGVIALALVLIYNTLVAARQLVENGWSDIDVQLKRRADLIPSIVETVKGYAKHERGLFEDITEKRSLAMAAGESPAERGKAEGALRAPLSRLFAVAEDYPDLKANDNFLDLQNELSDTETKIEMARRFYNGAVRQLNTKVQSFPINLVASAFGFGEREYFELDPADTALPDLSFEA